MLEPNKLPENVKMGHWYSNCCIHGLTKIENKDHYDDVMESLQQAIDDPNESIGMMTWENLEDAIEYFKNAGHNVKDDLSYRPDLLEELNKNND